MASDHSKRAGRPAGPRSIFHACSTSSQCCVQLLLGQIFLPSAKSDSKPLHHFQHQWRLPGCVPFSNATSEEIAADNPGNVYASNPRGSIMGRCDLASRNASFGWYSHQYNLTTLTGSGDSLILVINNSSSSASSPSPDVAASAMPGKLSADPWQMVMWPSFISGHVYPPLHHSP